MNLRPCALLCLALALHTVSAAVRNDSANVAADDTGRLNQAAKDADDGLATVALAVWADQGGPMDANALGAIAAFARRGEGYAGRAAIILATTNRREELITALAGNRSGRHLAAWTLAAWALFERMDDDALAEQRIGEGPKGRAIGSALNAQFGTGAVAGKGGKKAPARPRGKESGLVALAPTIADLLADKDGATRIAAAIAAAYAGIDDPVVHTALDAAAEKKGPAAAARLLLHARLGRPIDEAQLREAFADKRDQPRTIEVDEVSLSRDPLATPGAAMVCEAIGILGDQTFLPILHDGLAHKDLRVRIDAAHALRRMPHPSSIEPLLAAVKKPRREDWPVLVAVCAALADNPDRRSVEPLIELLKSQEKPPTRFRQDVLYALSSIAGNQFGRTDTKAWAEWWSQQPADFAVDPAVSSAFRAKYRVQDMSVQQNGGFYGLPIASDRLSFVLDYSNSMKGDPIANLKSNASMTISDLAKHVLFNLVAFNTGVEPLEGYGLTDDRKAALTFIENTALSGQTRSYDGTEYAFGIAGIDTLILLTDGQPTGGLQTRWDAIQPLTNLLLRYRPIAIHCIDFRVGGKGGGQGKLDPLDQYASEHAGKYMIVE